MQSHLAAVAVAVEITQAQSLVALVVQVEMIQMELTPVPQVQQAADKGPLLLRAVLEELAETTLVMLVAQNLVV